MRDAGDSQGASAHFVAQSKANRRSMRSWPATQLEPRVQCQTRHAFEDNAHTTHSHQLGAYHSLAWIWPETLCPLLRGICDKSGSNLLGFCKQREAVAQCFRGDFAQIHMLRTDPLQTPRRPVADLVSARSSRGACKQLFTESSQIARRSHQVVLGQTLAFSCCPWCSAFVEFVFRCLFVCSCSLQLTPNACGFKVCGRPCADLPTVLRGYIGSV